MAFVAIIRKTEKFKLALPDGIDVENIETFIEEKFNAGAVLLDSTQTIHLEAKDHGCIPG